jgi:REP-associated tyrosine transposase
MSKAYQSLTHSRWNCKYHVVFVPKRRGKALFGHIRQALGPIFYELARQKECRIIEGHLMPDHVHMCIEIPPKYGEHFWACGYTVSTVGFELEQVRAYIREQENADGEGRF